MTELTVEQRLDRLEKFTHSTCFRCLKEIPFTDARIMEYPSSLSPYSKIPLCSDCYSGFETLNQDNEIKTIDAQHTYLKEIRRQKK